jgi:hypothetical protein
MEVDDLTGRLTTGENRALMEELVPYPRLQHKLRLLINTLCRSPTADKLVSPATTAYALFQLNKNMSIVYKKQQRLKLHQEILTPRS